MIWVVVALIVLVSFLNELRKIRVLNLIALGVSVWLVWRCLTFARGYFQTATISDFELNAVSLPIAIVAYFLGSFPSGLVISKSQGIDIREHGSKNIGATNVWRTMGKKWGLLAFFCDTFKGWLAVTIGVWIASKCGVPQYLPHGQVGPTKYLTPDYAGIAAALGCIIGHNFPVWLRFKGGKGVATSLGVTIGMMPMVSLVIFGIWAAVFKIFRYVSLASLIGALLLPIVVLGFMFFGPSEGWAAVHGWGYFYFAVAAGMMVIKRHVANIQRLLAGTELRVGEPKPAAEDTAAPETTNPQTVVPEAPPPGPPAA